MLLRCISQRSYPEQDRPALGQKKLVFPAEAEPSSAIETGTTSQESFVEGRPCSTSPSDFALPAVTPTAVGKMLQDKRRDDKRSDAVAMPSTVCQSFNPFASSSRSENLPPTSFENQIFESISLDDL